MQHVKVIGVICTLTLLACTQGEVGPGDNNTPLTLQLAQTSDGDLEYCDEAGECTTLPYDGECAVVEIEIDETDGATCERCIHEDDTQSELECTDPSVGCVVVSIPDPDCLVCAYVNGAVFFSTCIPEDTPECYLDADCVSEDGVAGFCFHGQCIYESGCLDDEDCPPGFVCELTEDEPEGGDWYGACVPRDIGCGDDDDCPGDMHCERWCFGEDDPHGICRPPHQNPCEEMDCAPGTHCEVFHDPCEEDACPPVAECVPDPHGCEGPEDCPEGFACTELTCPAACTDEGESCPPCFGVCTPVDPPHCETNEDCDPGEVCEFFCVGVECTEETSIGVCIPLPPGCESNEDCEGPGYCVEGECVYRFDCDPSHAACDMVPPECENGQVITVIDGCFGPCVEPGACEPAQTGCSTQEDCPELHDCAVYCWDCDPEVEGCESGCEGVCVPFEPDCLEDAQCEGGECIHGRCVPEEILCDEQGNCPEEGLQCHEVCVPVCEGGNCTEECHGVCLPPPSRECFPTGCSGEICSDREQVSICEWLPEYQCLRHAECGRHEDGACGWTETDAFAECKVGLEP